MVSPTILNGNNSSQINGKRKSIIRAIGQQSTKRIHQRIREKNSFMSAESVVDLEYEETYGRQCDFVSTAILQKICQL